MAPRKELSGRRVYSEAELRLLFRIKYLSQTKGLGLRETGEAILGDLSSPRAEARSILAEVRGDFIGLWLSNRASMRRMTALLDPGSAASVPGGQGRSAKGDPP